VQDREPGPGLREARSREFVIAAPRG